MLHIILTGQVWTEANGGNKEPVTNSIKAGMYGSFSFLLSEEELVCARLTEWLIIQILNNSVLTSTKGHMDNGVSASTDTRFSWYFHGLNPTRRTGLRTKQSMWLLRAMQPLRAKQGFSSRCYVVGTWRAGGSCCWKQMLPLWWDKQFKNRQKQISGLVFLLILHLLK